MFIRERERERGEYLGLVVKRERGYLGVGVERERDWGLPVLIER